jgi:hypothetical protein
MEAIYEHVHGEDHGLGLCLDCVGLYKQAVEKHEASPKVNYAVTLCPAWQTKNVMNQMVMAIACVPTCLDHIGVKQKTPEERAIEGGLLLGQGG